MAKLSESDKESRSYTNISQVLVENTVERREETVAIVFTHVCFIFPVDLVQRLIPKWEMVAFRHDIRPIYS